MSSASIKSKFADSFCEKPSKREVIMQEISKLTMKVAATATSIKRFVEKKGKLIKNKYSK